MAREYTRTLPRRIVNSIMKVGLRIGLAPPSTYLLTVRGRKSGTAYSTPVQLIEESDGRWWLVAPYGEVSWVKNARSAGKVVLSRGRERETLRIEELGPEEAAPILKRYLDEVPIVRPYFDVTTDSSLEEFAAEAPRHPVFRLEN